MKTKPEILKEISETVATMTYAEIRARVEDLLHGMTVAQLKSLAAEIDLTLCERTKARIVEEFVRRPTERKASLDRCSFR